MDSFNWGVWWDGHGDYDCEDDKPDEHQDDCEDKPDCPECPVPPDPPANDLVNIADTTYRFSRNGDDFAVAGEESSQVPAPAVDIRDDQGTDTFNFRLVRQAMTIDLNPAGGVSTPTAGGPTATIIHDSIIENVVGTLFADTIIGNDFANVLTGGIGGDHLTGNGGADQFRFTGLRSSPNLPGRFDTIEDFESGQDLLNLRRVDANRTLPGNQNFDFIGGQQFHDKAGELRVTAGNVVLGDTNGDGVADFKVVVHGDHVTGLDIIR